MTTRTALRFTSPRTTRLAVVLAGLGLLLAAGCDDKASPPASASADKKGGDAPTAATAAEAPKQARAASCQRKETDGYCTNWGEENISAAGMDHLKEACVGKFSESACPTDKSVGTCATPEGTKVFYDDGPMATKAEDAEKQCKEGVPAGTWKAN